MLQAATSLGQPVAGLLLGGSLTSLIWGTQIKSAVGPYAQLRASFITGSNVDHKRIGSLIQGSQNRMPPIFGTPQVVAKALDKIRYESITDPDKIEAQNRFRASPWPSRMLGLRVTPM